MGWRSADARSRLSIDWISFMDPMTYKLSFTYKNDCMWFGPDSQGDIPIAVCWRRSLARGPLRARHERLSRFPDGHRRLRARSLHAPACLPRRVRASAHARRAGERGRRARDALG